MKKLITGVMMLCLISSCSIWKEVPATMSGFKNGKGQIKGPIKQEELNQIKVSIIADVEGVVITPLNDGEETSYHKDGGIVRVPNVKTKKSVYIHGSNNLEDFEY